MTKGNEDHHPLCRASHGSSALLPLKCWVFILLVCLFLCLSQLAATSAWTHWLLYLLPLLVVGVSRKLGMPRSQQGTQTGKGIWNLIHWEPSHNLFKDPFPVTTSEPLQQALPHNFQQRNRRNFVWNFFWKYVPISQILFPAKRPLNSYCHCKQKRKMKCSSPLNYHCAMSAGKWLWNRGSGLLQLHFDKLWTDVVSSSRQR